MVSRSEALIFLTQYTLRFNGEATPRADLIATTVAKAANLLGEAAPKEIQLAFEDLCRIYQRVPTNVSFFPRIKA